MTVALTGTTLPAGAADATRGLLLYDGTLPLTTTPGAGTTMPCAACHRRSGLGGFEGGLAVPPIAGHMLFQPFDSHAAKYFSPSAQFRVRPAYDEASLAHLLRTGVTPDAETLHPAMPRYALSRADVDDLAAHLRGLSSQLPAGVDAHTLRVATITTPDADPQRAAAMLAALRSFVAQKNGESRHEPQRALQAGRTRVMLMSRKFRVWQLEHWSLEGEPATWGAQLEAWQARRPVYAIVAGLGRAQWAPIDAFCERHRLPCLLPLVESGGGAAPGFYSVHYHPGVDLDTRLAARVLRSGGIDSVDLRADPAAPELAQRVRSALLREGLQVVDEDRQQVAATAGRTATVSLLAPAAHLAWLKTRPSTASNVVWLAGTHALRQADVAAALAGTPAGWIVTSMRQGEMLERQLARSRAWLQSQRLDPAHADVAASALQAATALSEMLFHLDVNFTPEFLIELLEHGLENMAPWSPYPRLAIGPGQHIGSRGSWIGKIQDGQIDWQWQLAP